MMQEFNFSGGIIPSLDSFANRAKTLYLPKKAYYFYRYFENNNHKLKDVFNDTIEPNSHVLFELPTLYYSSEEIIEKIKEAKQKNCTGAVVGCSLILNDSLNFTTATDAWHVVPVVHI